MHTMNDLVPKDQTPGEHRIQVQGIIITGKFGEGKLIVRCEYTLGHRSPVSYELFLGVLWQGSFMQILNRSDNENLFGPGSYGLGCSNKLNILGYRKSLFSLPDKTVPPMLESGSQTFKKIQARFIFS